MRKLLLLFAAAALAAAGPASAGGGQIDVRPGSSTATVTGTVAIDQTTPGTTNAVAVKTIGTTTVSTGNGTAGSGTQRVTIASDNTAFSVNSTATGNVASGAADSGNPVKVGGKYNSAGITLTNGQRGDLQLDSAGRLLMVPFSPSQGPVTIGQLGGGAAATPDAVSLFTVAYNQVFDNSSNWYKTPGDANGTVVQPALAGNFWSYAGATGGITNTSDVAVKAAAGAGVRNFLCSLQVSNSAAVASEIVVKDGATVIWRGYVPASMTTMVSVPMSPCLRGTANTALNVAMITTGTATRVSAQGYTGS